MVWPLLAAGVAAAGNLVGSWMNAEQQDQTNQQNLNMQEAANRTNLALRDRSDEMQWRMFNENMRMQENFARSGIRWRVEDAQAAGLHPLYALGGQPLNFSPISVGGGSGGEAGAARFSSSSPGAGLAAAGQDIGRAINATRTTEERALAAAMAGLGLERASLENDLLRSQIAKNNASSNPAFPGTSFAIPGQADSGAQLSSQSLVTSKPLEQTPSAPGAPHAEPGAITDVGYARTTTGWAPVPSKDVKERIEDQLIPEIMWAIRNNLLPTFGANQAPPPFQAPEGKTWIFHRPSQEYRLVDARLQGRPYVPPGGYR